jgi:hypothetical protein
MWTITVVYDINFTRVHCAFSHSQVSAHFPTDASQMSPQHLFHTCKAVSPRTYATIAPTIAPMGPRRNLPMI